MPALLEVQVLLLPLPLPVAMSAGALEGIVWDYQRHLDGVAVATELYDNFFKYLQALVSL